MSYSLETRVWQETDGTYSMGLFDIADGQLGADFWDGEDETEDLAFDYSKFSYFNKGFRTIGEALGDGPDLEFYGLVTDPAEVDRLRAFGDEYERTHPKPRKVRLRFGPY